MPLVPGYVSVPTSLSTTDAGRSEDGLADWPLILTDTTTLPIMHISTV